MAPLMKKIGAPRSATATVSPGEILDEVNAKRSQDAVIMLPPTTAPRFQRLT
jgi:hypothetical protein